jgi:hypothetical protein
MSLALKEVVANAHQSGPVRAESTSTTLLQLPLDRAEMRTEMIWPQNDREHALPEAKVEEPDRKEPRTTFQRLAYAAQSVS